MAQGRNSISASASALLLVAVLDLSNLALSVIVFAGLLGIVDLGVLLGLIALRAVITLSTLAIMLAPLRAWQRRGHHDDQQLREAQRALAGLFPRFAPHYVIGWVSACALALLFGYYGVPEPLPLGAPELLVGIVVLVAMSAGITAMLRSLVDAMLPNTRAELSAAVVARGLEMPELQESVGRRSTVFNLGLYTAVLLAMVAALALEQTKAERAQLVVEQRGRVNEAALSLQGGLLTVAELEPGLELGGADELPAPLVELAAAAETELDTALAVASPREATVSAAAPLGDDRWVLAHTEIDEHIAETSLEVFVFVFATLVPVILGNVALNRALVIPLSELDDAARRMAEQGDLRALARVVPLRNDELGTLAHSFNRMLDVFDELATAAATVAEGDLRVELHGRGDLHDAFRAMLARLHEMVVEVRAASLQVAQAASEIQATTKEQERAVDQQSTRMGTVNEAVTKLAQAAEDISRAATEVLDNAERTLTTTNAMSAEIAALNAQAHDIGELLELIRDVAKRSDLLALNGSLEATRAGDAGRGFGLVAAELRRLAERVTGAVDSVHEQLTNINATGTSSVMATESSRKLADGTAAAARQISTITQRQSQDTEQVSREVSEVSEIMVNTAAATTQTHQAAVSLSSRAAELERLTARFKLREASAAESS